MGEIVSATERGSAPLTGRKRQGLRRLSPDLINKAIEETNAQVTRIGLAFLGAAAFCALALFSPDIALLGHIVPVGGSEKINVPLTGPATFFGFMLLGPAVLIMLRVYLQIYVEHSNRLERLGRSMPAVRAPTLVQLKVPLLQSFSGFIFYLVLPLVMMFFAWKAAVFPALGSGFLCVAVGVIASHAMLPLSKISWRSKAKRSLIAAIVAGALVQSFGPFRRPFELDGTNLSSQWFPTGRTDLTGAWLRNANLSGATLLFADLSGAKLTRANLRGVDLTGADLSGRADLQGADLSGASLRGANLSDAVLFRANLSGADLHDANLSGAGLIGTDLSDVDLSVAKNLAQANRLNDACGVKTKFPEGFMVEGVAVELKPCPKKR
jgi:hypothetical protein